MKVGIATAKIDLSQKMHKFKGWVWDILFSDASTTLFSNLRISFYEDKKKSKKRKKEIKDVFKELDIKTGSTVTILFDLESHDILYIGAFEKDFWISVNDDYALTEPKLEIKSLMSFIY